MNKEARKYSFSILGKNTAEAQAAQAMKSRVSTQEHGISEREKDSNKYLSRVHEKKAAASISKGFKFTPSSSGVAKTKPKLPKVDKELKIPNTFNQTVNNPNKSLIKKSAILSKIRNAAGKAGTFTANAAKGSGTAIKESTSGIARHAGGANVRNFSKSDLGLRGKLDVDAFMKLPDSKKLEMVKSTAGKKKLKELMNKRDASRVVSVAGIGAGSAGAYKGHQKAKEKIDGIKQRRLEDRQRRLIQQYYQAQRHGR